jgi:hypothetical protein
LGPKALTLVALGLGRQWSRIVLCSFRYERQFVIINQFHLLRHQCKKSTKQSWYIMIKTKTKFVSWGFWVLFLLSSFVLLGLGLFVCKLNPLFVFLLLLLFVFLVLEFALIKFCRFIRNKFVWLKLQQFIWPKRKL